jgi:hypothetical protein
MLTRSNGQCRVSARQRLTITSPKCEEKSTNSAYGVMTISVSIYEGNLEAYNV